MFQSKLEEDIKTLQKHKKNRDTESQANQLWSEKNLSKNYQFTTESRKCKKIKQTY